jgi:hypothetical protein
MRGRPAIVLDESVCDESSRMRWSVRSDRQGGERRRTFRVTTIGLFAAVLVAAAGCGDTVDEGGFSAKDRSAASTALGGLEQTSVPTTLVELTNTAGTAPLYCSVHLQSPSDKRFSLFIFWRPSKRAFRGTFIWFRATLMQEVGGDTFKSGYEPTGVGATQVIKAEARDAFARPREPCQILMNGDVRLVTP